MKTNMSRLPASQPQRKLNSPEFLSPGTSRYIFTPYVVTIAVFIKGIQKIEAGHFPEHSCEAWCLNRNEGRQDMTMRKAVYVYSSLKPSPVLCLHLEHVWTSVHVWKQLHSLWFEDSKCLKLYLHSNRQNDSDNIDSSSDGSPCVFPRHPRPQTSSTPHKDSAQDAGPSTSKW